MKRIASFAFFQPVCIAILFALLSLLSGMASAQTGSLARTIEQIVQTSKGRVGVAVMGLEDRERFFVHGNDKFPMQSVFKFPLAMKVLDLVDQKKLSLTQKIHVTKQDLLPKTWSPLREKYPEANVDVTLADLLSYTVSFSDNNACDMLFRLAGGTGAVDSYMKKLGVSGMAIAATEEQMSKSWEVQHTNWCYPSAMLQLLDIFYQGKKLSKSSNDFLWKIMTETNTAPNRMKGLLPADARVAHKTGSGPTSAEGITSATNDAGIVTLPNGKHIAVVVYIADSGDSIEDRDKVAAKITKAAWDYFLAKK